MQPPAISSDFRFMASSAGALLRAWRAGAISDQPGSGHRIPTDFAGVCLAPAQDQSCNQYMLARLGELGVRQLRMDYTYNSAEYGADGFLEALLDAGYSVCLHLVQPFEEAAAMESEPARQHWQAFVEAVLTRWGSRLDALEVGSTVNRRRWAGYSVTGFFAAWEIAWRAARAANVTLAGPNVSDFEPIYNAGILARLQQLGQSPAVHTDNLFVERVTQPEVFDHRIAGRRVGNRLKFNTIKKARLLQQVGEHFGVPELWCSHVTWTAPRIFRVIEDTDQKQADYLSRYFLLAAASGVFQRVYWGALVCRSAGLIDDGTGRYPDHERVTLYEETYGSADSCRIRPAFYALQAISSLLAGQHYEGKLFATEFLQGHSFVSGEYRLHALWTVNAKAAFLESVYNREDLASATWISRDGQELDEMPEVLTEAPLFLRWPNSRRVTARPEADVVPDLSVHAHDEGFRHYHYQDGEYTGLLLARNDSERRALLDVLAPEVLLQANPDGFLRHARNAVWKVADPRNPERSLVVKRPVKLRLYKQLYERFRPSKAIQSWSGSAELLRRGLDTPRPVACFAGQGAQRLTSNFFVCEFREGCLPLRKLLNNYTRGQTMHPDITPEELFPALSRFVLRMHKRGVFFRDLSSGNILVGRDAGELRFTLVDTGRARFYYKLTMGQRLADLKRLCYKLDWQGRERFMRLYLAAHRDRFRLRYRIPFLIYDLKVATKRLLQGRGLKRK